MFLELGARTQRDVRGHLSGHQGARRRLAVHVLGQLRARLEYADLDELLGNLNQEMSVVQDVAAEVMIAVSTSYFAAEEPPAWTTEGTR